jgi:hypothetical protein
MTMRAADLDVLGDLATALGLVDEAGRSANWLSKPGDYLSSVLADAHQRDGLVEFVDNVLGGSTSSRAADGTVWLPIVERSSPDFHLFVLDDQPAAYVGIGLGVRLSATDPVASSPRTSAVLAAKGPDSGSPLLIGTADATIVIAADITTDAAARAGSRPILAASACVLPCRPRLAAQTRACRSPSGSCRCRALEAP